MANNKQVTELPRDNHGSSDAQFSVPTIPNCLFGVRTDSVDRRECKRRNFIPHRHSGDIDPTTWAKTYQKRIIDIDRIIRRVITEEFPESKFKWNDELIFTNLSSLLYHSSSKYISPYEQTLISDEVISDDGFYDSDI